MPPIRTVALVDGFNLYHALDELNAHHLKWLDLRALLLNFALPPQFHLGRVLYFSAYATWKTGHFQRHHAYVKALEVQGVEAIMGKFKEKERKCNSCGNSWKSHEEKETDVSIAMHLLDLAQRDEFERALLVSADSDLCPAVRMVLSRFPAKEIKVVTPPGRRPSNDLANASGRPASKIQSIHLLQSLLPAQLQEADGSPILRPPHYDPPAPRN